MDSILERVFSVTSVWVLTATIPVSLIWGETAWMVAFVGVTLAASLAFRRRLAELHDRFEHPIGYLGRNFKNDWTGWRYTKSNIKMIYNLSMIQKYHYILILINVVHFLISGLFGQSSIAIAYLVIMAVFSFVYVAIVATSNRID